MKTKLTLAVLTLALSAGTAQAKQDELGNSDQLSLKFTLENELICGAYINARGTDTGTGKVLFSKPHSDNQPEGISGINFVDNRGGTSPTVQATATLTLPTDIAAGAPSVKSNYSMVFYKDNERLSSFADFNSSGVATFPTLHHITSYVYTAYLYTEAFAKDSLPYGNSEFNITVDVSCK